MLLGMHSLLSWAGFSLWALAALGACIVIFAIGSDVMGWKFGTRKERRRPIQFSQNTPPISYERRKTVRN